MHGLGSRVNDPLIGRIDSGPSDVAFEHPLPMASVILRAIQAVEGHSSKNGLGTLPAAVDGIDDLVFEIRLELARPSHRSPDVSHAAKQNHAGLRARIKP